MILFLLKDVQQAIDDPVVGLDFVEDNDEEYFEQDENELVKRHLVDVDFHK